jgi:DNA-binding NtrC family response regulator
MPAKILLVDDDRLLREVVGEFLEGHEYVVELAESSEDALTMFEKGKYQLAILDLVMPGMNGLDLMIELMERDPKLYCLIMTGYPTIDTAYKAMVEGVSDYIIKPFQLSELLETVQKYI